ncbi:hypothetical protein FE840_002505 [Peteryoungia desertarenae]|uniref:Uncharacterized protein n=1 Tax=Peteryoungia desertarenae TaxID=1813451 RepID=A0ABX6QIX2_9HYPH|nr:hypothetical protein [Peteryoungia desertarenae]QLF68511.1 hypothetical protein FE840_002505 [Peteryoungia desertarenae]
MDETSRVQLSHLLEQMIIKNEALGQKVTALTMVCAYLLTEQCRASDDPKATLARMEGELGGMTEAIALQYKGETTVAGSSTVHITQVIESVLRQTSDVVLNLI